VARAALDYLEGARADGLGSMEIAATYQRIVDSL